MKPFQKKALAAAVVAGLGVGSAEAVYQDPNGLGQTLIYPYYTVQQVGGKAMNTLVSVVNTTSSGKVLKVRFREGKASQEVLDFNLFLSPNDVWTAAVVDSGSGGRLLSFDKSCTNPAIPATGVDFRNLAYVGDGAGNGLDRTREGYLEILELATVIGPALNAITHNSAGVPANCAAVRTADGSLPANQMAAPTGGISGTGTIVNVAQGSDIGYNAVALAAFREAVNSPTLATETNNMLDADPFALVVGSFPRTFVDHADFNRAGFAGVDAVSATMMHSSVINEFVLESTTRSNTDWVLTFPTKRYYVTTKTFVAPFTKAFGSSGACEPITLNYFDREEAGAVASGSDFSPSPSPETSSLCWESTVVSFRSGQAHNPTGTTSAVLGSVNTTPVTVGTFQNGWAEIRFSAPGHRLSSSRTLTTSINVSSVGTQSTTPATFAGLPVIGFMARSFTNTQAGTCDVVPCNYNSAFGHSYRNTVTR